MKQFYMYVIHNLRSDQLAFSLYKKLIPKVAKTLACIKWDLTLFFLFTVEKYRNRVNMSIKLKYATV